MHCRCWIRPASVIASSACAIDSIDISDSTAVWQQKNWSLQVTDAIAIADAANEIGPVYAGAVDVLQTSDQVWDSTNNVSRTVYTGLQDSNSQVIWHGAQSVADRLSFGESIQVGVIRSTAIALAATDALSLVMRPSRALRPKLLTGLNWATWPWFSRQADHRSADHRRPGLGGGRAAAVGRRQHRHRAVLQLHAALRTGKKGLPTLHWGRYGGQSHDRPRPPWPVPTRRHREPSPWSTRPRERPRTRWRCGPGVRQQGPLAVQPHQPRNARRHADRLRGPYVAEDGDPGADLLRAYAPRPRPCWSSC